MKEVASAIDRGVEYDIIPPIIVPDDMPTVGLTKLLAYRLALDSGPADFRAALPDEQRLGVLSGKMLGCSYNGRARMFTDAVGGIVKVQPA